MSHVLVGEMGHALAENPGQALVENPVNALAGNPGRARAGNRRTRASAPAATVVLPDGGGPAAVVDLTGEDEVDGGGQILRRQKSKSAA